MRRAILFVVAAIVALMGTPYAIADPGERSSTVADRELVNVTVYNGGQSLVHDRRRVLLDDGLNRIAWRDVSANMDATSAVLEALGSSGTVNVVEQNFDYDVLNPSALLQKYVGHDVTVVHDARFAGERDTREKARVLSVDGGIVLQYRDRIETEVRGHIVFPALPKNFRDRPTLVLDVNSSRSGLQSLDLSYLTSGMSWHADYIGVLGADGRHMSLTGLVTLTNTSGIAYENAHVQLLAGNVNVAPPPPALKMIATVRSTADVFSANASQENYFEYHLYTLGRPTTILDQQTKQVSLLTAHGIPVTETLELRGSPNYYRSPQPDLGDRIPVGAYVTFENRGGELGIPLPAGTVRVYKNDSHGISQFLGSDTIDHTPKNETVRLRMGDSFDVTARKKQTDFHFVSNCVTESSYQIVIGNAKPTAQDVLVVEPIPGQWQITNENISHIKSSAFTANWLVHVPSDAHATLTYTAQTSWCM